MSNEKKWKFELSEKTKVILFVAFLVVVFIINQIFYSSPSKRTGEQHPREETNVNYVDEYAGEREEDIEQQLLDKRIEDILAKLGITSYDKVAFDGHLIDGHHYVIAKSNATDIGVGEIRYLINERQIHSISWKGSTFKFSRDMNDPVQVAANFIHLQINHPDTTARQNRQQHWDKMGQHLNPDLRAVLVDPTMPLLGKRIVGNVEFDVTRPDEQNQEAKEVIVTTILVDNMEDEHTDHYTRLTTHIAYDEEAKLWKVMDFDVRKDGDLSGIQDGYRLHQ